MCSSDSVVFAISACSSVYVVSKSNDVLAALLQAGQALKLLSGAVPVVGGLASLAAAALKAGDRSIQSRRVVKVSLFES